MGLYHINLWDELDASARTATWQCPRPSVSVTLRGRITTQEQPVTQSCCSSSSFDNSFSSSHGLSTLNHRRSTMRGSKFGNSSGPDMSFQGFKHFRHLSESSAVSGNALPTFNTLPLLFVLNVIFGGNVVIRFKCH